MYDCIGQTLARANYHPSDGELDNSGIDEMDTKSL